MKKANYNSTMKTFETKSMLNELVFLGKTSKEVDISGFKFKLETLSEEKSREILTEVLSLSDDKRVAYVKGITLSKSILSINDISFDDIAKDNLEEDGKDTDQISINFEKSKIILSLQTSVTNKLYEAYEELVGSAQDSIKVDEIKNS